MNMIEDMACAKWECKEAEDFAFWTDSKNYHTCIFAVLMIKSCSATLTEAIDCHIGHNIHLLNDGAFVWTTMAHIIFPHNTIFNKVVHACLSNLTLETCDNNFNLYIHCFEKLFESLGTTLSIPKLNNQWRFLANCLKHPTDWFRNYALTLAINHFCKVDTSHSCMLHHSSNSDSDTHDNHKYQETHNLITQSFLL